MQKPITKLDRNNYNKNYKINHTKTTPKNNQQKLDALLNSYYNFNRQTKP
jgi:hypothetical protein